MDNHHQRSQTETAIELSHLSRKKISRSSFREKEYYEESPYRYYIAISYSLVTFANGFQWVTFSSCFTNFGIAYNLSNWKVNMFSLVYMIFYPIVCIPQAYIIDNYSTRFGLIAAAGFTLLGAGLKLFVNTNMVVCFIGQCLAGLLQPALLNSPGKIAAKWFSADSRTLITSILCLSNTIGIFIGFLFYTFTIDGSVDPETQRDEYKTEFYFYILCEFLLNCLFCFPTFFITTDDPTYPSSVSQARRENLGLKESLKMLFTNKNFIYLLISTCFIVGYYDVYGTILNSAFALYGITDTESSNIYSVSSGFGVVAAILLSICLDKTKRFRSTFIVLTVLGVIIQAAFTFLLELSVDNMNPYLIAMIMYSMVNLVLIPFYTIGMNYACEITYPVGESLNGGLMMTMSQLSGIGGTFFCDHLITAYPEKKYLTNVVLLIFFVIGCLFIFFLDDELERDNVDKSI